MCSTSGHPGVYPADAQNFLSKYPPEFTIINDPGGELAKIYDVIAMQSSYVFDRNGKQIARHLGFKVKRLAEYEALIVETRNASY